MTTPITELSLADLLEEASPTLTAEDETRDWHREVYHANEMRLSLIRSVSIAQDMVNRAEAREDAKPEHWKEAHGELVRVRRQLWDAEGEILMLRSELERRVRRVRMGRTA